MGKRESYIYLFKAGSERSLLHINIAQDPRRILVSVLFRPYHKSHVILTVMRHMLPISSSMDVARVSSKRIIFL
jgi:hypothetical protein